MKKIFLISIIVLILVFLIFFSKTVIKTIKKGNNMTNKSLEEIIDYILNIKSYEAEVDINVKSNKTENLYKLNQKFIKDEKIFKQEVIAPENIKGTTPIFDRNKFKNRKYKIKFK